MENDFQITIGRLERTAKPVLLKVFSNGMDQAKSRNKGRQGGNGGSKKRFKKNRFKYSGAERGDDNG